MDFTFNGVFDFSEELLSPLLTAESTEFNDEQHFEVLLKILGAEPVCDCF